LATRLNRYEMITIREPIMTRPLDENKVRVLRKVTSSIIENSENNNMEFMAD
jgi:hypothetical protein